MLNLDLNKIKDFNTREVFKQLLASIGSSSGNASTGPRGARGPQGPQGIPGEAYINIDGGDPFTNYGGVLYLDGGGV